jgi:hypothetical protein
MYINTKNDLDKIDGKIRNIWKPIIDESVNKIFGEFCDICDRKCIFFDSNFFRESKNIRLLLDLFQNDLYFINECFFISKYSANNIAYLAKESKQEFIEDFINNVFIDSERSDSWNGIWPASGIIANSNCDWIIWISAEFEVGYFYANSTNINKFLSGFTDVFPFLSNVDLENWFSDNPSVLETAYRHYRNLNAKISEAGDVNPSLGIH